MGNLDGIRQVDLAFEDAPNINRNIATMRQLTTDVDARRIRQTHTCDQQLIGQIALVLSL